MNKFGIKISRLLGFEKKIKELKQNVMPAAEHNTPLVLLDIMALSAKIQSLVSDSTHGFRGQCLNASLGYADRIGIIVSAAYPERSAVTPYVAIGNIKLDGELYFSDDDAKAFASSPSADTNSRMKYHAWIEIDEVAIDLTLAYSLANEFREAGVSPQTIFGYQNRTAAYGPGLEFIPYKRYTTAELLAIARGGK